MNRTWPLLALLLAGCGYVVGSPFRPDVRSVAVPIFQNDTYRKGVEFQLTEAVQKEMQQRGLQIAEEPYASRTPIARSRQDLRISTFKYALPAFP